MRLFKSFMIIFILCGFASAGEHSREQGQKFITNYTRRDYAHASSQNWSMIQDRRGVLYFANTEAVLEYDGFQWRDIPLSNRSAARSIAMDSSGVVYVGGQNEFGYLKPDSLGKMRYESLLYRIPEKYRNFEDVHRLYIIRDDIYLQTNKYFFLLRPDTLLIWTAVQNYYRAQLAGDRIYVQDYGAGLMLVHHNQMTLLPNTEWFKKERLYGAYAPDTQRVLLFTRAGCYVYDGSNLRKHPFAADDYLIQQQVYNFTVTPDGDFAFSTSRGGVLITDTAGNIRSVFNQSTGLNDDNVRYIYFDRENNLWMCMNNGLAKINYYYPVTFFSDASGLKGSVQSLTRYRGRLYAATSQGIYYLTPADFLAQKYTARFERLQGIETQSWYVHTPDDKILLAGTNDGVVLISGDKPQLLTKGIVFTLHYSPRYQCIFAGFQNGAGYFEYRDGNLGSFYRFNNVREEVRVIAEDERGFIWLGTRLQYVLRLDFPEGLSATPTIVRYDERHGLQTSRIFPGRVEKDLKFFSSRGIYRFSYDENRFVADSTYNYVSDSTFRTAYTIKDNPRGEIWLLTHENKFKAGIGFFRKTDQGQLQWVYRPFHRIPADPYYFLLLDDDGTAWMGGPNGILRYQETGYIKNFSAPFSTLIRQIDLLPDSTIFFGAVSDQVQYQPEFSYANNSIRFLFSATSFDDERSTQYQYWLEGFDADWSVWSSNNVKEYTNLPEGSYIFHVRARNVYGYLGQEARYAFIVLPPWYRTWWAYMIYAGLLIGLVAGFVRWRSVYLEHEKLKLEKIIEQRTIELKNKNAQLETIDRIVQSINSKYHVDEFLGFLIEEIGAIVKTEHVAAVLLDPSRNVFSFVSSKGWSLESLQSIVIQPMDAVEWFSKDEECKTKEIYIISTPRERFENTIPPLAELKSLLVLRLEDPYQISGYLLFGRKSNEPDFDIREIELLANLRQHIFSGFMKAQLVTHLESMNDELKRLNDQKNEFLGIAAHDLRNPLGAIIGYLDLILMDMKTNKLNIRETINDIEMVLSSARQMVNLITELLDISAIESGKINLELKRANLNQIFEECERIHKKAAAQKRIRLIIDRNEHLPEVIVDRARIAEVVDNLLSNAIKYTYPEGEVRLYTEVQPKEIRVHVRDTGQGLNEQDLQHVFRSFRKLSARPTGGESSTGFGLAIVKKIVELHNGRVWVESKVNQGSTFSFSIPIRQS